MPPDLVLDRQTKQQKTDANGERPSSIELVRTGAEGGKVPSDTNSRRRPRTSNPPDRWPLTHPTSLAGTTITTVARPVTR
jgi:hypothetical protein